MKKTIAHISVVVLTLNEESNMERCLSSLSMFQDVVVLDSGSTDGTCDLSRKLGARVYVHIQDAPFEIDRQRNWALNECDLKNDWVLFLDADETVNTTLVEKVIEACSNSDNPYDAYELTPRYIFWGRWLKRTQGYPNWHPRLLNRGLAHFTGGVWEHFSSGTRVGRIDIPYDHYANSKGFSDWLKRHDRYSSWDAQKLVDFLETGNGEALGTERKLRLRIWAARFWPIRPFCRFFQMYIIRMGFLEGFPALVFCGLYFFYESMTVIKVIELRRQKRGLSL